jgi:hypothetical protein
MSDTQTCPYCGKEIKKSMANLSYYLTASTTLAGQHIIYQLYYFAHKKCLKKYIVK